MRISMLCLPECFFSEFGTPTAAVHSLNPSVVQFLTSDIVCSGDTLDFFYMNADDFVS